MIREDGYYWVKTASRIVVAEWYNNGWWLTGDWKQFYEGDFEVLGKVNPPA